jgi:DNA-binding transcriptional ArsR family regulator
LLDAKMNDDLNREQMKEVFEEVSHYFFLLSEPTRLKILYALCDGEQPVGAIVKQIEANQANVSRQLNMLYQAKILQRRKDGAQVYYRIEDQNAIQLCRVVCAQMVDRVIQQTGRLMQAPMESFVVKEE